LGSFVEDYIYLNGAGDLDQYNGRFCVTPEFPKGTYAYFVTTDLIGKPAFPYTIGSNYFYGTILYQQSIGTVKPITANKYFDIN
jgi:hypothetical protein